MDGYKQQLVELYNSRTDYDHEEGTFHPYRANYLLNCVPLQKGQKVLDVATGTGLVAISAAQRVCSQGCYVIGIDITPGMLDQARQKVEVASLQNIELIEADAKDINFSDSSFDAIFCCEAIMFLDMPASLQKWYRFLKPGGFVAFTCPPETAYMASVYRRIGTKLFGRSITHILEPLGTPEKCHNLLQQAGFRDIEVKIERSGRDRHLKDERLSFSKKWISLNFKGDPLVSKLSQEQLERLQVEYKAEIDKLATDQKVWEDTTTFFVRARK